MYKSSEFEEDHIGDIIIQGKLQKLCRVKEELKRAKEEATQSWLDSKPLIDELEKLQSGLSSAKNRTSMSNIVILELESQLEAIKTGIRTKMEEEIKATKMTYEMTQAADQAREELEKIKLETEAESKERMKLKQILRMKRQTLRTLQLTLRAIRLESEAFRESKAEALGYISFYEAENSSVIQLTKEEFNALTHRAKDEASLADWRISVSIEQKLAAEASRTLAWSRLKELNSGNRSSRRQPEDDNETLEHGHITVEEAEEKDPHLRAGEKVNKNRESAFPKARERAVSNANSGQRNQGSKSKSTANRGMVKKKKKSFFRKIQIFFKRIFG